jgi:hypothetical protein
VPASYLIIIELECIHGVKNRTISLINSLSWLVQLLRKLFLRPALGCTRLLDGYPEVVADLGHCKKRLAAHVLFLKKDDITECQ